MEASSFFTGAFSYGELHQEGRGGVCLDATFRGWGRVREWRWELGTNWCDAHIRCKQCTRQACRKVHVHMA